MLPPDILRLILLESSLQTIHTFLIGTRLTLHSSWWRTYFLKQIPSSCSFLWKDDPNFRKKEGIHILHRAFCDDATYFKREAYFHRFKVEEFLLLNRNGSITLHGKQTRALDTSSFEADMGLPLEVSNNRLEIYTNMFCKRTIVSIHSYGQTLQGMPTLHEACDRKACFIEDIPSIIHRTLLFEFDDDPVGWVEVYRDPCHIEHL